MRRMLEALERFSRRHGRALAATDRRTARQHRHHRLMQAGDCAPDLPAVVKTARSSRLWDFVTMSIADAKTITFWSVMTVAVRPICRPTAQQVVGADVQRIEGPSARSCGASSHQHLPTTTNAVAGVSEPKRHGHRKLVTRRDGRSLNQAPLPRHGTISTRPANASRWSAFNRRRPLHQPVV